MEELNTGAKRSSQYTATVDSVFPPRYDLLPIEGLRRWAEAFGEGTQKYGDGNFRKGFEDSCLVQHALAHLFLYTAGDTSEDHLGHAMWNIGMLCKMEKERPELCKLKQQIAQEYDSRERPVYVLDDPRCQPKGMDTSAPMADKKPSPYLGSSQLSEPEARRMLRKAYDIFMGYGKMHADKGSHEKAAYNYKKAEEISEALGLTR